MKDNIDAEKELEDIVYKDAIDSFNKFLMNEILNKIYYLNNKGETKFNIPRIDVSNKYEKTDKDDKK